jgi:CRISPR-associated protein Cmr6
MMQNLYGSTNVGWSFYRDYFSDLKYDTLDRNGNITNTLRFKLSNADALKKDETEVEMKARNRRYEAFRPDSFVFIEGKNTFKLSTQYPGLILGTGYVHEVKLKGELKLGLFFDHTSGLPLLPGSSVKGVIRDAFPKWHELNSGSEPEDFKWVKTYQIKAYLESKTFEEIERDYAAKRNELKAEISALENYIFEGLDKEGKPLSIYHRDQFLDAVLINFEDKPILNTDSITPHIHDGMRYEDGLLKNPVPIPFLKIAPHTQFQFNFNLTDNGLTADAKEKLFKQILMDNGIGAKTNVGYGVLVDPASIVQQARNNVQDRTIATVVPQRVTNFAENIPRTLMNYAAALNTGLEGVITAMNEKECQIEFTTPFIRDEKLVVQKKIDVLVSKKKREANDFASVVVGAKVLLESYKWETTGHVFKIKIKTP